MRVLLVNPPYLTLTSILGVGHQVPLGLLMVGGPLLDAGHEVKLLDAECKHLSLRRTIKEIQAFQPDVVKTGHAGSTPAHPVAMKLLRALRNACPEVTTVYGGVYPSYHATDILREEPSVDIIVRGEGEAVTLDLIGALEAGRNLATVPGISYRDNGKPATNPDCPPIQDLDQFRTAWELIDDWDRYQCFGLGRAAIVQFSRGCPHQCSYCGQRGFWTRWRHRDPVKLVDEIERLCREHNIRFLTLADENPTTLKSEWQRLLEELASRDLPVHFLATIRATDIVRDAEILDLYRKAGILYVLLGIESTSPDVIEKIRKGSSVQTDYRAIQLLREHEIYSIMGHIVGFEDETWDDFRTAYEQLSLYDGDYLNAMYVTPHRWTQFGSDNRSRKVVQLDQSKWDYRHQIFEQKHLKPWQLLFAVKWLELRYHLRPKRLRRILFERRQFQRRQHWWNLLHTSLVWFGEIFAFVFSTSFVKKPVPLAEIYDQSSVELQLPILTKTSDKREENQSAVDESVSHT